MKRIALFLILLGIGATIIALLVGGDYPLILYMLAGTAVVAGLALFLVPGGDSTP